MAVCHCKCVQHIFSVEKNIFIGEAHYDIWSNRKTTLTCDSLVLPNNPSNKHWTSIAFKYSRWYRRSSPFRLISLLPLPWLRRVACVSNDDKQFSSSCCFSAVWFAAERVHAPTSLECDTIMWNNSCKNTQKNKHKISIYWRPNKRNCERNGANRAITVALFEHTTAIVKSIFIGYYFQFWFNLLARKNSHRRKRTP